MSSATQPTKTTFSVWGWLAGRHPCAIQKIVAARHEIQFPIATARLSNEPWHRLGVGDTWACCDIDTPPQRFASSTRGKKQLACS